MTTAKRVNDFFMAYAFERRPDLLSQFVIAARGPAPPGF
jgi:hypothetical protein